MDNKPLMKWHAKELIKLLSEDPNNSITVPILVGLETVFMNSSPYKDIKAQPPENSNITTEE